MTDEEKIECLQHQVEFKTDSIHKLKEFIEGLHLILQSDATDETKIDLLNDEIGGIVWGCTDKNCSNYNRNATQNDSSCAYYC